jgi:SAM-dependent methyltransferase
MPVSFEYSSTELGAMERAVNYHRWICDIFTPYIGPRVLEVGAGIGSFSEMLLCHPCVRELIALEPAANLFPILARRLASEPRALALQTGLEDAKLPAVDSIVLVNVLEHIADDARLLERAHSALADQGTLLLFVPALEWLYGSLDRSFEHVRRYSKERLARRLSSAGFRVGLLRYMNLPGIFSWFVAGKLLRHTTLSPADVAFYDRFVVPIVRRAERVSAPPIGQSLIAVAEKSRAFLGRTGPVASPPPDALEPELQTTAKNAP